MNEKPDILLGDETLTIHHGRRTFISHALAGGRTLAKVRDAAGHANVSITSGYLHIAVEDEVRDAAGHANESITSGYLHVAVENETGAGNLFDIT